MPDGRAIELWIGHVDGDIRRAVRDWSSVRLYFLVAAAATGRAYARAVPGIVAFVGVDAADTLRAVDRLRRRPWHAVQLLEDAGSRAVVGVVGENGGVARDPATGVLAAVDGEFVESRETVQGPACAGELLRRYLRCGVDCEPPDGWFAAAIWDPRSARLSLLTDRLGARPIYRAVLGTRVFAAGELKALVAAGVEPRLDHQAAAEMLAYEFPLGDHTLLEGVSVVSPASMLTIGPDGVEHLRRRWRYRLEPAENGDDGQLVEELARLMADAVEARLDDTTALSLSGGLDSRSIAATLRALGHAPMAVSFGAPGCEDLRLATEVAARAGLRHLPLPFEAGYLARGAAEVVWLGEGQVRCFHAHHLALQRLREVGLRSVLIGYAGDVVFRASPNVPPPESGPLPDAYHRVLASFVSDELLGTALTPEFARTLRGRARDSLAERLAEEDADRVASVRQFFWNHVYRRKVLPGALLFADDVTPRDPHADAALIEFCRRMPERLRRGGTLQRAYLARFPELAKIRNPKDGLPPSLTGRRREFGLLSVKVRGQARNVLERRLGVAVLPSRRGIGDYGTDLRAAGRPLLELLLEPRTLARGQFREDGLRHLVEDVLGGRRRQTRALGALLTLELFQRQFIDGVPPDTVAGLPAESTLHCGRLLKERAASPVSPL